MMNLEFRQAESKDAALLAQMNQRLIQDEGHRNLMSLVHLEDRMSAWLHGDYTAFIFLNEQALPQPHPSLS